MTRARVAHLAVVVGLAVLLAVQAWLLLHYVRDRTIPHRVLRLEGLSLPLYALAVPLVRFGRLPLRAATAGVLLGAAVLAGCAMTGPPVSSDDDYRYVWDAKVQFAGVDPYRYPPSAPELARLRDAFLFPPPSQRCTNRFTGGCTLINRPDGRTIYPPIAELAFDVVYAASFGDRGQHLPLQLAAGLGILLVGLLIGRRAPPWRVALWSWCPVTIVEFANNAHIDWLGVLFAVLALQACAARRPGWAGILVGAAAAVKLYPALVAAAMLRRRPLLVVSSAVGLVAVSYLPHVAAVGAKVVGYLPTYLQEEAYTSGGRFLLFRGLWSGATTQRVVVVALVLVAVVVVLRSDPDRPERGATALAAAAFVLASPDQSWYYGLLLALVALTGWIELMPIVLVGTLIYLHNADFGLDLALSASYFRYACVLSAAGVSFRLARSRITRRA